MKKVIYICYEPLTAKVERDWYIDHLIVNGVDVEYWDCSSLFYEKEMFTQQLKRDYVRKIQDYRHIEALLKGTTGPDTMYIMLVLYEFRAYRLYRLLRRYKCRLLFIRWAIFPRKNRIISKILRLPSHPVEIAKRILDKLFIETTQAMGLVDSYEKVFCAGAAAASCKREKALQTIPINMCDYDNFVLLKNTPNELSENSYCVFLDCNLPFHPDFGFANSQYVDPGKYFNQLNRFFGYIEQKYGVDVVIAGHPSSNYEEGTFNGRRILKSITPMLVRDAKFVITHHSASVNYAILNQKPIIFIFTTEMEKLYSDNAMTIIRGSAELLNASIYNIDNIDSVDDITVNEADKKSYDLYKYNYLTSQTTENAFTRDIFLAAIIS